LLWVAVAGFAIAALAFAPWISYRWLNEDCPSCGPNGVYLVDYADRGSEVNGLTSFGDGFIVAGAGLLLTLLALATLRFRLHWAAPRFGIAFSGLVATGLTFYDARYTWTAIETKGPEATSPAAFGYWYPRLIFFETHPTPWLYLEIALGAVVTLLALILLAQGSTQHRGAPKDHSSANAGKAWA
jgi:hypothetical protein